MNPLLRHITPALFLCCMVTSGAAAAIENKTDHAATPLQSGKSHRDVHAASQSTATMQQRAALLKHGEAALAAVNIDAATQDFERAGLMLHAADAELGLVRTYMQAGEYAHALSFCSHTAGAHLDDPDGAAFYAWLLHIGGQGAIAQRLLSEAKTRLPGNPLLDIVSRQLSTPFPLATAQLLKVPARFAPYGSSSGVPSKARVLGTGVLIDNGRRVVVPIATLMRSPDVWVRNGLGQLVKATVEHQLVS